MTKPRHDDSSDAGEPDGCYANYLAVGHNVFEFVLDFGQVYAGDAHRVHTRIVTNPAYAKAMAQTLSSAIEHFEQAFGPIPQAKASES